MLKKESGRNNHCIMIVNSVECEKIRGSVETFQSGTSGETFREKTWKYEK